MTAVDKLVKMYQIPIIRKLASKLIRLLGADIPLSVKVGKDVTFCHNSVGTVIHRKTIIEDHVKIYQNVTIGRADIYRDKDYKMYGIIIKKGAIICAGAKVLCKEGILNIGENAIVAANAVLLNSIGDNEIWGGIPAKKIGERNSKAS